MLNKLIPVIIILFLSAGLGQAQEYYVIQVRGTVKKNDNAVVKPGQTIRADDKLTFSSANDAVAVANAKSGRFIIQAKATTKPGEFYSLVKDALTPGVKRLSTRHGELNSVVDFQTSFKEIQLMLPELRYRVNAANFPLTEDSFFYLRYNHKHEVINKKLAFAADTVMIVREQLFSIDGHGIEPGDVQDVRLYYFTKGASQLITPVTFDVTAPEILQTDARELMAVFPKNDPRLREELFLFLNEFYGKVSQNNFEAWFAGIINTL